MYLYVHTLTHTEWDVVGVIKTNERLMSWLNVYKLVGLM